MSIPVSRRRLLQLAAAPALLSRAHAQVQDLAPAASRVHAGLDGAGGTLYDNVQAPLTARFWKNINIGWAGANTVCWNCEGDFLVQKPPTAQNFSFGHIGVNAVVFNIPLQDSTKDDGHIESLDRHVTPRSLYPTQLRERLGDAAVRQIATAGQIG